MDNPFSGWLHKAQSRGEAYTALDAMKLLAVVSMTADHIGYYFYPDDMWWRAAGRVAIPVWFFLVGYSRTRSIDEMLWTYGILLIVSETFLGGVIFPITVLIVFVVCRHLLNFCEDHNYFPSKIPEIIAICWFLSLFTVPLFEYGSPGFLFAVFGYMVRRKQTQHFTLLVVASYILYIIWQFFIFPFSLIQAEFVMLGTAWVVLWLARFPNTVIWPTWSYSWWKTCITVLSRNTMAYYFYHRIIMELASTLLAGKSVAFSLRLF